VKQTGFAVVAVIFSVSGCLADEGDCLLLVEGKSVISGPCEILVYSDGGLWIGAGRTKQPVRAVANINGVDKGRGNGAFNITDPNQPRKPALSLGTLAQEQQGACWVNEKVRLCAWKDETRPAGR
jgi:hypothetical protein